MLNDVLVDIAKNMGESEYFTLGIEQFNNAAKKYREIGLSNKRLLRMQKVLEKQRAELDEIITQIQLGGSD